MRSCQASVRRDLMSKSHVQSADSLIILASWFTFLDGLFQPMHLLIIGIIVILLFGKRLPDVAFWLGKKLVQFEKGLPDQAQGLAKLWEKVKKWLRRRDNDERGDSFA